MWVLWISTLSTESKDCEHWEYVLWVSAVCNTFTALVHIAVGQVNLSWVSAPECGIPPAVCCWTDQWWREACAAIMRLKASEGAELPACRSSSHPLHHQRKVRVPAAGTSLSFFHIYCMKIKQRSTTQRQEILPTHPSVLSAHWLPAAYHTCHRYHNAATERFTPTTSSEHLINLSAWRLLSDCGRSWRHPSCEFTL